MSLPWSIEKILGWRSRYEAMQRCAARCEKCYSDGRCVSSDFEDFFLAFMVVCYHLRDFVIETGRVRSDAIDRLIQDNEAMRICRGVCNRSKHHTISKASIDELWSLGREYRPWPDGSPAIAHFLIAGSKKREPLDVVRECKSFWDGVVAAAGLAEPSDPFARH